MRITKNPTLRAAVLKRAAFHLELAAARLGSAPQDYLSIYPSLGRAIARRAIQDVRDTLVGRLPNEGMTDDEAMQEARLWQEAWSQPISMDGLFRSEAARRERYEIRARGLRRQAAHLTGQLVEAAE